MPYDRAAGSSHIGDYFDGTAHRGDHQDDLDSRTDRFESSQKDSNGKQRAERMKGANPSHGDHRAGADTPSCECAYSVAMVQILAHVI
jgi:hypothetical protein